MSTPHAPTSGPVIRLSHGHGHGPTTLAAFDAALLSAGVADFNLLRLSSVIPPGARVEVVTPDGQIRGEHGDLLYCVYACATADRPGTHAWAGIAWALRPDGSGAGLFVEHQADSRTGLEAALSATLGAMVTSRPEAYQESGRVLADVRCTDLPAAAVVVASYRTVGWGDPPPPARSNPLAATTGGAR
ncbi:pyruvoyl-dependent arginine decarboxylase [uncultured Friedmanniella sp.]|uniref:pyruvoyl-dependent arginine decarboxylase n=1 Tax=uncultured Friedmanniella sp. TaxID=335381 RepID=UPI0035CC321D